MSSIGVHRRIMPGNQGLYTQQPDQPDRKQDRMHHDAGRHYGTDAHYTARSDFGISTWQQRNQASCDGARIRLH